MRLKQLKLLIVLLIGLTFLACAKQPPLELPPSMISNDPNSGWRNY